MRNTPNRTPPLLRSTLSHIAVCGLAAAASVLSTVSPSTCIRLTLASGSCIISYCLLVDPITSTLSRQVFSTKHFLDQADVHKILTGAVYREACRKRSRPRIVSDNVKHHVLLCPPGSFIFRVVAHAPQTVTGGKWYLRRPLVPSRSIILDFLG
jgi:hypothetical protein